MRFKLTSLVVLMTAVCMLTSCLNDDDDNTNYNFSEDTALSGFTLGTLNRYWHTKSSTGADSTYKTTYSGSAYKMIIDQHARRIYNTDSLPYGTDVKHVLATVTAVNNGLILIKNVDSDSLRYYSSSDSIDFSSPRTFRIVSQDGQRYSDYTVTLNVRHVPAGTVDWEQKATSSELAQLSDTRALSLETGKVFVFGHLNGRIVGYSTAFTDGTSWIPTASTLSENASIVAKGNMLYALDEGNVLQSVDGEDWTTVTTNNNLKRLVAASTTHLYALTTDDGTNTTGIAVSADNGKTWTSEQLDADASLLPDEGTAYATTPVRTNDSIDQVVIAGRCSAAGDNKARVWSRLDDYSSRPISATWSYVDNSGKTNYILGDIQTLVMTAYKGNPYALVVNGNTLSTLLYSLDGGISWKNSGVSLPEGLTAKNGNVAMTVDSNGSLWIISDGQVWKN